MPALYLPKVRFIGSRRKRGSYYQFSVRVGHHVDISHLRYYPEDHHIMLPGRPLRNSKRRFVKDIGVSPELLEALLKLCQERFQPREAE